MKETAISVTGLVKDFHDVWGRPTVRGVAGCDWDVFRGEVFGLLGPNGSGKTTSIKMILGLLKPTQGEVKLLGGSPHDPAVRRNVGYLPEENIMFQHQRSEEELANFGRFYGLGGRELHARVEELLKKVGIFPARNRYLKEFSKGMGRRHGLARAMIGDPELLILDEPTSGLDPVGVREVKDLILELKAQGKSILLSSHLLSDVEEVCDRVGIMYMGRMVKSGPVGDLLEVPDRVEVVFRSGDADRVKNVIGDGGGLEFSVSKPRKRLEELFLKVVGRPKQRGE
ncbi:MAG: ABC transporter ATP-binding protein [Planctomycetes bacterium]|nr:ABC transporter ATP-binding protein [Planctomycetota bacterium]